jgi:glutamate synthase (NADPH/NADH) large chain
MQPDRPITPSTLSVKDLPWQISGQGQMYPVRPLHGGLPGQRHRTGGVPQTAVETVSLDLGAPCQVLRLYYGIRQKTDPAYACVGCAMCSWSAPTMPSFPCAATRRTNCASYQPRRPAPQRGRAAQRAGGILDQIKFIRISMLTDPALDAGRHEFELRTLLGRVLPPEENLKFLKTAGFRRFGRSIR